LEVIPAHTVLLKGKKIKETASHGQGKGESLRNEGDVVLWGRKLSLLPYKMEKVLRQARGKRGVMGKKGVKTFFLKKKEEKHH